MEKLLSRQMQKMSRRGHTVSLPRVKSGDDFHKVVSVSGVSCDSLCIFLHRSVLFVHFDSESI